MRLAYISTKTYTSSTADHVYIKKLSESFSSILGDQFSLVINDDHSEDELMNVASVIKLDLGKTRRAIKFFFGFPALYRKMRATTKLNEPIYCMANDKYILATFCVYRMMGYRMRVCSDWHVVSPPWLDRFVARRSDYCTCVTSPLRDLLITSFKVSPEKILVTPNAIDLAIFGSSLSKEDARTQSKLPHDKILLGYFGRFKTMGMEKGIREILESLSVLPMQFMFFAAGGLPEDVLAYQGLADTLGISSRVIFRGESTQKELAQYQRACDILLMPFPYTHHYAYIMSPMKMFEYMASRRPIIATDLPSVHDILAPKRALLIPPDDSVALTTAVLKLSDDPAQAEALSKEAYAYIVNRTWDTKAKEILQFFGA